MILSRFINTLILLISFLGIVIGQTPTLEVTPDGVQLKSVNHTTVSNPTEGMLVWNGNTDSFWYHDGTSWNEIKKDTNALIDADGDTGIEAIDLSSYPDRLDFNLENNLFSMEKDGYSFKFTTLTPQFGNLYLGRGGQEDEQGYGNIGIGYDNLTWINGFSASSNIAIGNSVLNELGYGLPSSTYLSSNISIGDASGFNLNQGYDNVFVGQSAGSGLSFGYDNVMIGSGAGQFHTTGSQNVVIGNNTNSASSIYYTQSGTVKIGYDAGALDSTNNVLHIANNLDKSLIWGDFANDSLKVFGNLGIGDHYNFPTTDGTVGQVLSTDGNGEVTWTDDATGAFENASGLVRSTGNHNTDDFVFGSDALPPLTAIEDSLFFFDKSKGAFRAGTTAGFDFTTGFFPTDAWSESNIGNYSAAFGRATRALGTGSVAIGDQTEAIGSNALAAGAYSVANASASVALGYINHSNGVYSVSLGAVNQSNGRISSSIGSQLIANAYSSTVVGRFNDPIVSPQNTSSEITDLTPAFLIGNGSSDTERSNVMVVNYGGSVGLSQDNFNELLNIGSTTGDGLSIGSFEYIEDGGGYTLITNADIDTDTHLSRDMGTSSNAWDDIYADEFHNISDMRAKENVEDLNYGLAEILSLSTISYILKDDSDRDQKLGLSAQELLIQIPEVVKTHDTTYHEDGSKTREELDRYAVNYIELIPVLIKSIQEQQVIIEDLKKEVADLKKK